jgi:hypothetical protein
MKIQSVKFDENTISFSPHVYVSDQQEANKFASSLITFADKMLNDWSSPEIIFAEKAGVNELDMAVDAVLRDALDRVDVHPCDANNDEVKLNSLSDELKFLYKTRHNKP